MTSKRKAGWSSPLDAMLDRNRKELEQLLGRRPRGESSDRTSRRAPTSVPASQGAPAPRADRPAPSASQSGATSGKIAGSADGVTFSVGLD